MLIRIVKMHFREDKTEDFLKIFNSSHQKIRSFEGCSHLTLVRDTLDKSIFFTISHWESENYLQQYRESDLFKGTWSRTKILFKEKALAWSTKVYTQT